MLKDYESDHQTGMDVISVAKKIHDFTSGYPFLVSCICKCIDEKLEKNWNKQRVTDAVSIITSNTNLLFDDIVKNLVNNENASKTLHSLLMKGHTQSISIHNPHVGMCLMYGYLKVDEFSNLVIANKIFAKVILSYFISKESLESKELPICRSVAEELVTDGKLNMEATLEKFAQYYGELELN